MSFTQVPNEAIDRMTELSAGAWRLYCFLLRCRNRGSGRAFPSVKIAAEAIGTHPNNIYRLRKELAAIGWVTFDGNEVNFLLGVNSRKNATAFVDSTEDSNINADFSKNAKPFSKNAKDFRKNAKKFSKNAKTYKEQQYERTIRNEQYEIPGAVAPAGGLSSDECYALFVEVRSVAGRYEVPYQNKRADFVQLAKLLNTCEANKWTLTADRFRQAARNYFETPRNTHTLADLAAHFSDFYKHPFDRFGKPVKEASNGRTIVTHKETPNERNAREYEELIRASVAASNSDVSTATEDTDAEGFTIDVGGH